MNKKFIMAALAGVMTVCGFTLSAEDPVIIEKGQVESLDAKAKMRIVAIARPNTNFTEKLTTVRGDTEGGLTRGYLIKSGSSETFVPLSSVIPASMNVSKDATGNELVSLGRFEQGDTIQFGFKDENGFSPMQISVLSSDPAYYAGYNADSFYQLDFSEDEFDGRIDVLVVGEPLPSSTVTLILSLAALAVFMGYARRKQQRANAVQES